MNLINIQNNLALALNHLLNYPLQALLKLTLILGTRNKCTHIKRINKLVLKILRHITMHNPLRKPLRNSRLTNARLTHKNRIVLGPAAEDLQHPANLLITAYHRIKFPLSGQIHQIHSIALQCPLLPVLLIVTVHFKPPFKIQQ